MFVLVYVGLYYVIFTTLLAHYCIPFFAFLLYFVDQLSSNFLTKNGPDFFTQLFFQFGEAQVLKEQRAEYLWKQLERPIPDIRHRSKAQRRDDV